MPYCPFLPRQPKAQKIVDEAGKIYSFDFETGLFKDDTGSALAGASAMTVVEMQETFGSVYGFQPAEVLNLCIGPDCQLWDSENSRCGLKGSDLLFRELGFWEAAAGQKPPAASSLVNEYLGNQDLDGNGLIYGVDFHITDGRPPMLDGLPLEGDPMTWAEYTESL